MIESKVFSSEQPDSKRAIQEILKQACSVEKTPAACVLYAGYEHDGQVILNEVQSAFPKVKLIGGTSSGAFARSEFFECSVVCAFIYTNDQVQIDVVAVRNLTPESTETEVTSALKSALDRIQKDVKLVICHSSGLEVNGSQVVALSNQVLRNHQNSHNALLWGGGTIDDLVSQRCREFFNSEVLRASAVFMIFSGELQVKIYSNKGWEPMGERAVVTEARGNVISKISGKPALDFYKGYLGPKGTEMTVFTSFPMALYLDDTQFRIRAVFAVDGNDLVCAGDVPNGVAIKLTKTSKEKLLEGVRTSVDTFRNECPFKPTVGLMVSCVGRRFFLGVDAGREIKAISSVFPDLDLVGFFAGGEISPLENSKDSYFHNNTATLLLIG